MLTLTKRDYDRGAALFRAMAREAIPTHITAQTVAEWAETKRVLGSDVTSRPGRFSWSVVPYWREVADCLSETSSVRKVVICKGSQIGCTTAVLENALGYIIDAAPGPSLYISGDANMAASQMSRRVDALIANAGLSHKLAPTVQSKAGRKTGDTATEKQFAGGFLRAIGPNSAAKIRSDSIRYLLLDEVDAYPQDTEGEGDPISLAERRTDAFEMTRKILALSTPLIEHTSRIWRLYQRGDQRRYYVPCKHCGHMQPLEWEQIQFNKDPDGRLIWESVAYACIECAGLHTNSDKPAMLSAGEWRPTSTPSEPGLRSYHLSALYSPVGFRTWASVAQELIDTQAGDEGTSDPLLLKVWRNTALGLPFRDYAERPRIEALLSRPGTYESGQIPDDAEVFFLTLGADVQKDRIECEIVAWSTNFESWSVGYHVLPCSPEGTTEDPSESCWTALTAIIEGEHAGRSIAFAAIDSGYNTPTVYEYCDQFEARVCAVMGFDELPGARDYVKISTTDRGAGYRVDVNSSALKAQLWTFFNATTTPDTTERWGVMHFPTDYDREYFHQLTGEERIFERKGGRERVAWRAHRRRVEALDCRVYSLAMVHLLRHLFMESRGWNELRWRDFWDWMAIDSERDKFFSGR